MILSIGLVRASDDSWNNAGSLHEECAGFTGCGIEVIDPWMSTAKLPRNHVWSAARKEKASRKHSHARRTEIQDLEKREPAGDRPGLLSIAWSCFRWSF